MIEAFERIALELRHLYSIGYRPSSLTQNAEWHHLKVRLRRPSGFRVSSCEAVRLLRLHESALIKRVGNGQADDEKKWK